MKEIRTEIMIDAPAARIWDILADFARYPEWNPFVTSVVGTLAEGERLEIHVEPPGGSAMTFKPVVVTAEKNRKLAWKGSLLFPAAFSGEHSFELQPGEGGVRFLHGEEFNGFLVPLIWWNMAKTTRAGFEAMNGALKQRAENR